jgi:hypothetical protein
MHLTLVWRQNHAIDLIQYERFDLLCLGVDRQNRNVVTRDIDRNANRGTSQRWRATLTNIRQWARRGQQASSSGIDNLKPEGRRHRIAAPTSLIVASQIQPAPIWRYNKIRLAWICRTILELDAPDFASRLWINRNIAAQKDVRLDQV